ncbi:MAG: hypothetical protein ACI4RL_03130, partial [Ruminococcus sp.]
MPECTNCTGEVKTPWTEEQDETCPAKGFQKVSICVPVTVTPFARAGKTVTKCCGDAKVVSGDKPCPGKKNGTCTFTL